MLVVLKETIQQMCSIVELQTVFHEQAVCKRGKKWKNGGK